MTKKGYGLFVIAILALVLLINIASAYGLFGFNTPADLLDNDWFVVGGIFALFFAIIFFSLMKAKIQRGPAVVIALVASAFVSLAVYREVFYSSGLGYQSGEFLVILAFLIVIFFVASLLYKKAGMAGIVAFLIAMWVILRFFDMSSLIPSFLQTSTFYSFYDNFTSIPIIIVLAISFIAVLYSRTKNPKGKWHHKPRHDDED